MFDALPDSYYVGRGENKHMEKLQNEKSLDFPWAVSAEDLQRFFNVDRKRGLSKRQVKENRQKYGTNIIRQKKRKSVFKIFIEQFKSLIILLLAAAAALSFSFGEMVEGFAVVAVIVINALIGFITELKAVRSMEALRSMGGTYVPVRRAGNVSRIRAEEVVPGDIVVIESGALNTADIRIAEASKLQADESPLTGESLPVSKTAQKVEEDIGLSERNNMLFKGTAVTRGSGEGIVVHVGMQTELGKISAMVEEAEKEVTPLEKRLDKLGRRLIWVTLVIAAAMGGAGIAAGKDLLTMIETAIALAVASIPEGLPIVATIALARGMWIMARRNALINKLSSVETLGATSLICTDKTGTLTENKMTVESLEYQASKGSIEHFELKDASADSEADELVRRALRAGVLCNNAELQENEGDEIGDPLEIALINAGAKLDIRRKEIAELMPEVEEIAFESETKMMATIHEQDGKLYYAVKGAPNAVLEASTELAAAGGTVEFTEEEKKEWLDRNNTLAAGGLRVIALAEKEREERDEQVYEGLRFLGLAGMLDPPRADVKSAIEDCKRAGIRIVMITGDQALTAQEIGRQLGLVSEDSNAILQGREIDRHFEEDSKDRLISVDIFARVSPKQKLSIINLHQKNGSIVAMTGDGVNDAPALKKADIGVAMGDRGTEVAREASDMVLTDDAFPSIVSAVRQGRIIYANIRKFVLYLLSCNLSEILSVGIASFFAVPIPLLPLQILFLNLVTDVFPALALGVGKGSREVMNRPPRDSKEPVLRKAHWEVMIGYSLLITAAVIASLLSAIFLLGYGNDRAVTVSFLTLAFAQLWHVFNMRNRGSRIFINDISGNPWVWAALGLCTFLLLFAVYLPPLAAILDIVPPGGKGWLLVIGFSFFPLLAGQGLKELLKKKEQLF